MGLDQYGMIRNANIDWKKVYSDKYDPMQDGFVWRKHARLQQFMAKEYAKQNPKEDTNAHSGNIDGLGFNGEDHKVTITKDILKRLDEAINEKYRDEIRRAGAKLTARVNQTAKNLNKLNETLKKQKKILDD